MDFLWNSSGSDSDDAWMALQQLRAHQMQHQPTTDRAAFAPRQMKRRKIETKPRAARYGHLHPKGDQRRQILNHENSSWWELIHHPDVFDPISSTGKKFRRIFRLPWSEVQMLCCVVLRGAYKSCSCYCLIFLVNEVERRSRDEDLHCSRIGRFEWSANGIRSKHGSNKQEL